MTQFLIFRCLPRCAGRQQKRIENSDFILDLTYDLILFNKKILSFNKNE